MILIWNNLFSAKGGIINKWQLYSPMQNKK